jgi:hypothetical protein
MLKGFYHGFKAMVEALFYCRKKQGVVLEYFGQSKRAA